MEMQTELHAGSTDDSPTTRFRRVKRRLRVGFVLARDRTDRAGLARALESTLDRTVQLMRYASYADLAEAVTQAFVDVAWVPPGVFAQVRGAEGVRAVAALARSGAAGYRSALLARSGTFESVEEVVGARAAWVDPWSAAGYVVPRGMLASEGLDIARAISSERFYGSYDAALDALTVRVADIAGAFCTVDAAGKLLDRGWSSAAPVRVLALSGAIPADLLCTTSAVPDAEAREMERLLTADGGRSVASAIGGSALVTPTGGYDPLEHQLRHGGVTS